MRGFVATVAAFGFLGGVAGGVTALDSRLALAGTGLVLMAAAVTRSGVVGLVFLMAVSLVNPFLLPVLYEVGEITVRLQDVVFLLVGAVVVARLGASGRSPAVPPPVSRLFLGLAMFIGYIALSMVGVLVAVPGRFFATLASFLRLAQYALLVPLTVVLLRRERDVERIVQTFGALGLASVGVALPDAFGTGDLLHERVRVAGLLGINSLGLVSALLCLLGLIGCLEKIYRGWVTVGLLMTGGVLGLVVSKSMNSTLGLLVAGGLYLLVRRRLDLLTVARWLTVSVVCVAALFAVVRALRPSDFEAAMSGRGGSFVHRAIVGTAGLGIFGEHPFLGIGWQATLAPEVIGGAELNRWLRRIFADAPRYYFPDLRPASVHNLYIQILAELGLVGMGLFLWLVWCVVDVGRRATSGAGKSHRLAAHQRFLSFGLILLAVWWNTRALFGGQIETFLTFVFIGGLAATACLSGEEPERPAPIGLPGAGR